MYTFLHSLRGNLLINLPSPVFLFFLGSLDSPRTPVTKQEVRELWLGLQREATISNSSTFGASMLRYVL